MVFFYQFVQVIFICTHCLYMTPEMTIFLQFNQGENFFFVFLTVFVIFLTFFSKGNIVDNTEQAKLCCWILVWRQTALEF